MSTDIYYDDTTQITVHHDSLYGLKLALEKIIQGIEYGDEGPLGLAKHGIQFGKYRYTLETE